MIVVVMAPRQLNSTTAWELVRDAGLELKASPEMYPERSTMRYKMETFVGGVIRRHLRTTNEIIATDCEYILGYARIAVREGKLAADEFRFVTEERVKTDVYITWEPRMFTVDQQGQFTVNPPGLDYYTDMLRRLS